MPGQGLQLSDLTDWGELGVKDGSSPSREVDGDNGWCSERTIIVSDDNEDKAITQILGYSERVAFGANNTLGRISRYLPECDPRYAEVWADKIISSKGIAFKQKATTQPTSNAQAGVYSQFKRREIRFSLRDRSYDVLSDSDTYQVAQGSQLFGCEFLRFVDEQEEEGGDYLTMPEGAMSFNDEFGFNDPTKQSNNVGKPMPLQPARVIYSKIITWTWHEIPDDAVPWASIQAAKGTVNNSQWPPGVLLPQLKAQGRIPKNADGTDFVYPAHTLLFLGSVIPMRTRNSQRKYHRKTITYKVKYQPWGHTRFFDYDVGTKVDNSPGAKQKNPDFFRVTIDGKTYLLGSGVKGKWVTDESDFSKLFSPA